jgi:hypothetical protein
MIYSVVSVTHNYAAFKEKLKLFMKVDLRYSFMFFMSNFSSFHCLLSFPFNLKVFCFESGKMTENL